MKVTYSRHYRPNAEGHVYLYKPGPCTIEVTGAVAMSQEELDWWGEKIAAALRRIKSEDIPNFEPRFK